MPPSTLSSLPQVPTDFFRFTIDGARKVLGDAGFEVVKAHRVGGSRITSGFLMGFGAEDLGLIGPNARPRAVGAGMAHGHAANASGGEHDQLVFDDAERKKPLERDPKAWLYISSVIVARRPPTLEGGDSS